MPEPKVNVCPPCKGRGWVPDKPWKQGRNWMVCGTCSNAAGLPEPERAPVEEDWPQENRPQGR